MSERLGKTVRDWIKIDIARQHICDDIYKSLYFNVLFVENTSFKQ